MLEKVFGNICDGFDVLCSAFEVASLNRDFFGVNTVIDKYSLIGNESWVYELSI